MTACSACGRSPRARLYCHRTYCGGVEPEGAAARLAGALARLRATEGALREATEAAYALSQDAPAGERRLLLNFADRGSDFLALLRAMR